MNPNPFPRYFKAANNSEIVIRFDHYGFGIFQNTGRQSEYWTLAFVLDCPDRWLEITAIEAEELKGKE